MGANLVQYGLGLLGLNRVKNPIALKDGELTVAQNAAVSLVRARAGIRKRLGFGLLLPGAGDPLLALLPIPFDDWHPGDPVTPLYPPYPVFPGAPYVYAASDFTSDGFTLTWDPVPWALLYKLLISLSSDMSDATETDLGDVTTINVTGLAPNTTYYYQVVASNDRGDGPGSDVGSAKTDPAPAPSSGTFTIFATGAVGWAGANDVVLGVLGSSASCAIGAEETAVVSYGPLIALDGGAPVDVATLPAGFSVTLAGFYVDWLSGGAGEIAGDVHLRTDGPETSATGGGGGSWGPSGFYCWFVGPLTAAGLCASTCSIRAVGNDGGVVLQNLYGEPTGYITGTYEVVP